MLCRRLHISPRGCHWKWADESWLTSLWETSHSHCHSLSSQQNIFPYVFLSKSMPQTQLYAQHTFWKAAYILCSPAHKPSAFCGGLCLGQGKAALPMSARFQTVCKMIPKRVLFPPRRAVDGDSLPGRDLYWCCINSAEHPAGFSITSRGVQSRGRWEPWQCWREGTCTAGKGLASSLSAALLFIAKRYNIATLEYNLLWRMNKIIIKKAHYKLILIFILRHHQNIINRLTQLQWSVLYK